MPNEIETAFYRLGWRAGGCAGSLLRLDCGANPGASAAACAHASQLANASGGADGATDRGADCGTQRRAHRAPEPDAAPAQPNHGSQPCARAGSDPAGPTNEFA